jgi:hypothetical protein
MPIALYDLHNLVLGVLICGIWGSAGVAGFLVFHRLCRAVFTESERSLALALLGVVATVNSLLLAFAAVSVWDSYKAAEQAVRGEAATIGVLGRDLALFDTAESVGARDLLRTYGRSLLEKEWPAMERAQASDATWTAFELMFRAVGRLDPVAPREAALMPEIWARADELVKFRRERLYASEVYVPLTLWVVIAIGTLLTITTTYVFPRTAFNTTAVGLLSVALGMVFFFIVAMDRPFAGTESISPEPIVSALSKMDRWNEDAARLHAQVPAVRAPLEQKKETP